MKRAWAIHYLIFVPSDWLAALAMGVMKISIKMKKLATRLLEKL